MGQMTLWDDGVRLNAVLEEPEHTEGAGRPPLVIVLHGFSSAGDRPHNIRAAAAMREAGYATLRLDLYGHGKSGGEFRNHTLCKWISNTLAAVDRMREAGYGEILLSGHSQGGLVAAMAAGMEGEERIRGLILRAPAFLIPRGAREGNMLGNTFDPLRIPDEFPVIKGLTLSGNYLRVAQVVYAERAAERYEGPVLILHGDEDDTVPVEDSLEMAQRYRRCETAVIPGETHHFDRKPEQMRALIRDWLAGLETGKGRG